MQAAIDQARRVLLGGGVIAYPTEGVFGLGCLPDDTSAVVRILDIKERDPARGLILIAADRQQLEGWIELPQGRSLPDPVLGKPVTWIVPAADRVSALVRGHHAGVAVRLTTHPVARALCDAVDSPLVSTSANVSGRPVARNTYILRRQFGRRVDNIVPGRCGPASGPSAIRVFDTDIELRPAMQ